MDEEMNACELLKQEAKENRTWEILDILSKCKTIEEATEKIRALLTTK